MYESTEIESNDKTRKVQSKTIHYLIASIFKTLFWCQLEASCKDWDVEAYSSNALYEDTFRYTLTHPKLNRHSQPN